ncbi:MAG: hypothetical protein ACWGNI_03680, partial [Desulfobacterales bacterium]
SLIRPEGFEPPAYGFEVGRDATVNGRLEPIFSDCPPRESTISQLRDTTGTLDVSRILVDRLSASDFPQENV